MSHEIRQLTENDLEQLQAIRQVAYFETASLDEPAVKQRHLDRLPYGRGVFVGGKLAAAGAMLPFEMYHAGKVIKVGGLASVLTAAEHRRRGYVKALLYHELEKLRDEGVGFCLEYPFDARYYTKYGWQSISSGSIIRIPSEHLLSKTKPEAEKLDIKDIDKLKPIYECWAKHYNFSMLRNATFKNEWQDLIRRAYETIGKFVYYLDGAYCMIRFNYDKHTEKVTLVVRDYAYSHGLGRENLFAFLGGMQGQVDFIEIQLPANDPLLLDKQTFLKSNMEPLQARVVDVKTALESLVPTQEDSFSMHIHDDFCNWNKHTYRVVMEADTIQLSSWGQKADIELDIRALALMLSGGVTAEVCMQLGLITGELEAAKKLEALAGRQISFQSRGDNF